jgi:molecular chaperone DnaJ
MNYYEILGVESTATAEEIKEAYRNKAKEWHPDTLPRDANLDSGKFMDAR